MAVNRYREHLVVYLEDAPYREIMNGAKLLPQVNAERIDVKPPAGGWKKVFQTLEENLPLLQRYSQMYVLLLMDFDSVYSSRKQQLNRLTADTGHQERIFMLGIDHKESEDLKRSLSQPNHEEIAALLLAGCPEKTCPEWSSDHLACNLEEIQRMRDLGVTAWLFNHVTT